MSLRTVAISDIKFPLKSRDKLPLVLMALQYIISSIEADEMRVSTAIAKPNVIRSLFMSCGRFNCVLWIWKRLQGVPL